MRGLQDSKLQQKGWGLREKEGGGASEYYPHPIMISIITLTTLMDIKIVCDMVI